MDASDKCLKHHLGKYKKDLFQPERMYKWEKKNMKKKYRCKNKVLFT